MRIVGNIRKMRTSLEQGMAHYVLPLKDILEEHETLALNSCIGKVIQIKFENAIHCVVTGKKIKKAYGEGMSYDAYISSPLAVESIMKPELSRIHEGIALRDFDWEIEHHLQPHIVYLSNTSGLKVGVTRDTQIPTRWIDQGAEQAIFLAETPYRQAAGLIEVALKQTLADKTAWQTMLKSSPKELDMIAEKQEAIKNIPVDLKLYVSNENSITKIAYPISYYPQSVKSIKLDTTPIIEQKLIGIKGQYLIFENAEVINIRSHAGYRISIEI